MSITIQINVFKDLIEKYPSWEELQSFLESNEGGLFRIVDKNDNGFCLIRYEKGTSKMDLPHSKWFRSVVWNTKTNRPVCIAPPKAATEEFPYKTLQEVRDAKITCQELLEGFMINCFKVVGDGTLHITSRSKLNAAGKFYSEKNFRELFMEIYQENGNINISTPDNNTISTFYSFLVQHKEHKIVSPIEENKLYTIHRGVVYEDGSVSIDDSPNDMNINSEVKSIPLEILQTKGSYAKIAAQANELNDEQTEVHRWIKKQMLDRDWKFQGLVLKDRLGNRWRFRSEKYAVVKTLRGNSPNIQERFAQLYTQNLITKYLEYYPEDMMAIAVHMMFMDTVVKMLYDNYVDLHITKIKKANEIDKMFLPHLYSIHGIYLSQLRPNGKKVNFDEIKIYLHKQPWQRIVFLIKKLIEKANAGL
jgi:CRISPR/Cas system endoribonuclease Cas6 (RAMP superfamily)